MYTVDCLVNGIHPEEWAGKVRIPDVCKAEKIDSCGLADLIEARKWNFK